MGFGYLFFVGFVVDFGDFGVVVDDYGNCWFE